MRKLTMMGIGAVISVVVLCPMALAVEGDPSGHHFVRLAELMARKQQEDAPYIAFFWQMLGILAACIGLSVVIAYGPSFLKRCKNAVLKKMRSK